MTSAARDQLLHKSIDGQICHWAPFAGPLQLIGLAQVHSVPLGAGVHRNGGAPGRRHCTAVRSAELVFCPRRRAMHLIQGAQPEVLAGRRGDTAQVRCDVG
jgi:hypothetical protein